MNNTEKYFIISLILLVICIGMAFIPILLFGSKYIFPFWVIILFGICFLNIIVIRVFFAVDITKIK